MSDAFDDLKDGVVLAELGGYGDGAYCAKHGRGGALVLLGTYIVDPGDEVDYPEDYVFKSGRDNYASYLENHVAIAKGSGAKVGVSVVTVAMEDTLDFLRASEEAGADYVSYCAHSSMEMFVSKGLSSRLCMKDHWGALRDWASAIAEAVGIPAIFKIGSHGRDETLGAVEVITEAGVPIINIRLWETHAGSDDLAMLPALRERCECVIAGGGVDSVSDARRLLDAGADAVAIGAAAMEDDSLVEQVQSALRF